MLPHEAAQAIESMRVRGAALIARTAAAALAEWAEAYDGPPADFAKRFDAEAHRLLATRPTAVSLRNAMEFVRARATSPAAAHDAGRAFVAHSDHALSAIAGHVAAILRDAPRIVTHCNSQAALGGIIRAHQDGIDVHVTATESRPWLQGHITVRQLAEAGVAVAYVVDSAMARAVAEADIVLTGADTIAANGDVVNKIGTRLLALAAADAGVPFHACAETYKVDLRARRGEDVAIEERDVAEVLDVAAFPGVEVRNPVFDVTPARLVASIVTERGATAPEAVAAAAEEVFKRGP